MDEQAVNLVKQIQQIGYQILCDIDKYCEENSLTYYLSGGSCLGAVRHHGFIPWDDDVDIMLPREDYERFLIHFGNVFPKEYHVGSLYTDDQWERPAARIWDLQTEFILKRLDEQKMGVFVDVYPIDGLPERHFRQRIFFLRIKILNALKNATIRKTFFEYEKFRRLKIICAKILHIFKHFDARWFSERMDKIAKRFDFKNSTFVGASLATHYGIKERIQRECMEKGMRIPFESGEFPVPVGYDIYLKNLYGDYMEIPEETAEKGYTHLDYYDVKINLR